MGVAGAFSAGLAKAGLRWVALAAVAGFVFFFRSELADLVLAILGLLWWMLSGLATLGWTVLSWLVSLVGRLLDPGPPQQQCRPGYVLDGSKRECVRSCMGGQQLDAATQACVPVCAAGSTLDRLSRQCVPKCDGDYTLDPATRQCVSTVVGTRVALRKTEGITESGRVPLHIGDLSGADTLVLVGTASREGELRSQEAVAQARARQLAQWIAERTGFAGNLLLVNLGQFTARECPKCAETDTRWQRPIIIIGVAEKLSDARLKEAVLSRLDGSDVNLPNRAHYSISDPVIVTFRRR
jgi:hypothetical protein